MRPVTMKRRELIRGIFAGGTLAALGACAGLGSTPSSAKVVIVGGGYGGATAAKYVRLGSGGVSAARSELEASYANGWARNIWPDTLG